MRRCRALAPITLAAVLVAGCTIGDSQDAADSKQRQTPTSRAAGEEPAPAGSQMLTADDCGVRFAVPADWTVLDAETLASAPDDPRFKHYADSVNVQPNQLRQVVDRVDVMAAGQGGENINALKHPDMPELPSESALETELTNFNVDLVSTDDVDTAIGTGILVRFTLPETMPLRGGAGLFVEVGGAVVNITATAADDARATELIKTVIASLART